MRVLLIYPNLDSPVGVNHGLTIIAGVLEAAGHEARLVHVNEKLFDVPSDDELAQVVREWGAGLVGFSLMTQQVPWANAAARGLRARCPEVPLVAGGVHCTMVPDEVGADATWDAVAVGEAELPFRTFVDLVARGEDPTRTPCFRFPPGTRWNPGPRPIVNAVAPFPDLAALPPNRYELFDMRRITRSKNGWQGVLTSRGCPYTCTYCFNKEIVDRYKEDGAAVTGKEYLRHYPIERVIGELEHLKRAYPETTTFIFDDDLFTLDRRWVHAFCEAYEASGLSLPFVVNAHVQVFDDDMASALARAGCSIVKYGLESGSKRVRREVLSRTMTNQRIKDAFAAAHRHGLHTSAFVMFGLPTETRAELDETLRLIAETELGRFRWAMFFPFPGTAGHRMSERLDLIDRTRMGELGNYFEGTCLRWDPAMHLFLDKLGRAAHWWVNAASAWEGCAEAYRPLVEELESWDRATFEARKGELHARDRALSERLLREGVRHYSLRYTHVMGVDSRFVLAEREKLADRPQYVPVGYTLDD